MTRMRRIHADQYPKKICENPPHPRHQRSIWLGFSHLYELRTDRKSAILNFLFSIPMQDMTQGKDYLCIRIENGELRMTCANVLRDAQAITAVSELR